MALSGFKYRPNGIRSVELAKYFVFHVEQKVKRLVIGRIDADLLPIKTSWIIRKNLLSKFWEIC